jgi:hypothetical protein
MIKRYNKIKITIKSIGNDIQFDKPLLRIKLAQARTFVN